MLCWTNISFCTISNIGMAKRKPVLEAVDCRGLSLPDDVIPILNDFRTDPDYEAVVGELRRLVKAWTDSGRNLERMLESHLELIPFIGGDRGLFFPLRTVALFDGSGLRIEIVGNGPSMKSTAPGSQEAGKYCARMFFIELLLNPERDRLSEHPCPRCNCYFIKKTLRQKVYCSRKCGLRHTAALSTMKRLKAEHEGKLRIARQLARGWASSRTKEGWKSWICKTADGRSHDLTPRFLTRAVNKGELTEPTKGER